VLKLGISYFPTPAPIEEPQVRGHRPNPLPEI
jgi:hypothetical protein